MQSSVWPAAPPFPTGIVQWCAAIDRLPPGVLPVAVVYADWRTAAAPDPPSIVERAAQWGCAAVLVDTFDKSRGTLMRYFDRVRLGEFIATVQARGMMCVVAGGLGLNEIPHVAPLGPDYVAVRGAACAGGRNDRLEAECVRRLVAALRTRATARRTRRMTVTTGRQALPTKLAFALFNTRRRDYLLDKMR